MADTRISCNIPSDYNAALLYEWARQTGRPVANLGSVLLEEGLNAALHMNRIPVFIVEQVNERLKKRNEAKPEKLEDIDDVQIKGEAVRAALRQKRKDVFDKRYEKHFETALNKSIPELEKLDQELPGI